MKVRRIVKKRIRHEGDGVQLDADVNAAINVNVNEAGQMRTRVSDRRTADDPEAAPSGPGDPPSSEDSQEDRP